jgi:hypothetical protein
MLMFGMFILINDTTICITRNLYIFAKLVPVEELPVSRFENYIDMQMYKFG